MGKCLRFSLGSFIPIWSVRSLIRCFAVSLFRNSLTPVKQAAFVQLATDVRGIEPRRPLLTTIGFPVGEITLPSEITCQVRLNPERVNDPLALQSRCSNSRQASQSWLPAHPAKQSPASNSRSSGLPTVVRDCRGVASTSPATAASATFARLTRRQIHYFRSASLNRSQRSVSVSSSAVLRLPLTRSAIDRM